ncbi:MAG: spore cortex biosynthesis protein YabQ [Oscillospiraceae bacterium]|nr:spore cortex biosynthesis protein YabQ [Oscillospiraceae bacterium]
MRLPVSVQGLQALASLACGPVLGFFYDLLAQMRRRFGLDRLLPLFDALFCAVCACVLFLMGSVAGRGRLRLFMPLLMALGGGAYCLALRRFCRPAAAFAANGTAAALAAAALPLRILKKIIKKITKKTKNIFSYLKLCYKMKYKPVEYRFETDRPGGERVESQEGRYFYEDRNCRADGLCDRDADKASGPYRRGGDRARRPYRTGKRASGGKRRA